MFSAIMTSLFPSMLEMRIILLLLLKIVRIPSISNVLASLLTVSNLRMIFPSSIALMMAAERL